MEIEIRALDHPDAALMVAAAQAELKARYGEEDLTAMETAEFAPPRGLFAVGYQAGRPVACGGWRVKEPAPEQGLRAGDVELKRLLVVEEARGRGLSRKLLAWLEDAARLAGHRRMVLETGTRQPEAIGLYLSSGYQPIAKFGFYRDDPESLCYAKPLTESATPRP
ncbi:GNAT family N-acetyltransferase [Allostreptomyces psammosilenae]|uniref:GNAT superfamily N-acetyltransferase n=1 Tax=Allostreptomyces psammosilenae TaxID=1892865 RepID=A0A852ZPJ9_9ACTN|nr:GNAT family N-acetyltransferase [Allostreptomyces psammosilenae]NYI04313.1 GNAT superfamily N-acetyltransferase [Allostreptomyces psammosilenae]